MISVSKIYKLFNRVETPRYLDSKIQEVALAHLKVKDVGELRDKYDAQAYLNKLSDEIRSEFAFEKFMGFDYDIRKRMNKNFSRLQYKLDGFDFQLSFFTSKSNPTISKIKPTVLIFLKPEKSVFIGPLIHMNLLDEIIYKEDYPMINSKTLNIELVNFEKCIFFRNKEEFISKIKL